MAALLALLLTALAFVGAARAQEAGGILVQGSGTVRGAPDLVRVDLGVVAVDADPRTALDAANEAATALREAIAAAGVADEDVQTTAFNVWRQEEFRGEGREPAVTFRVEQRYAVTLRDLDALGGLLQSAVEAGANDVGQIRFGIADPEALERRARELAMEAARAKAEQLADLGGVALGAPTAIRDLADSQVGSPAPERAMALDGLGGGAPPVESGQLAVTVRLEVDYAIAGAAEGGAAE